MKSALIIGNNQYNDPKLAPLKTPEVDTRELAKVLRAKHIGNFDEVSSLTDPTELKSRRAISRFLSNRKPDDLVLLYFSGHGVLDERGSLFLALKDTQTDSLNATAISSSFLSYELDKCRSKRQILILDCCNSGAFERGTKGEVKAISEGTFEGSGSGRVVLTATDSTQFAFEGDQIIQQSELSLFTHFLLEGLKTGAADLNNDGNVSLDEWYEYIHSKITEVTPKQVPHKWSYRQQGDLIIARNPFIKEKDASASHPLRATLDQKLLDYRQHKITLDPQELEVMAAELAESGLQLGDAHKQLLLFSALAHGEGARWLESSGPKGPDWLRQAYQDESCPKEARLGAAALLGTLEDRPTYERLLDRIRQEGELEKRDAWLDLLTHYLNSSAQSHRLPWQISRLISLRLIRLQLKQDGHERARMSRLAGSVAPACALIGIILRWSNDPAFEIVGAIVIMLIAAVLAIAFAQVITSLALLSRRWPVLGQVLASATTGSALGAILFLLLANQMQVGYAGGLIAVMQSLASRPKAKFSTARLATVAALLVFAFTSLMTDTMDRFLLTKIGYAFSASLFSFTYVYAVRKQ
jgi:uncharacterized caspase-like protein/cytochrome b